MFSDVVWELGYISYLTFLYEKCTFKSWKHNLKTKKKNFVLLALSICCIYINIILFDGLDWFSPPAIFNCKFLQFIPISHVIDTHTDIFIQLYAMIKIIIMYVCEPYVLMIIHKVISLSTYSWAYFVQLWID